MLQIPTRLKTGEHLAEVNGVAGKRPVTNFDVMQGDNSLYSMTDSRTALLVPGFEYELW